MLTRRLALVLIALALMLGFAGVVLGARMGSALLIGAGVLFAVLGGLAISYLADLR